MTNKKAALEMSIGTIVIIVIAVTMLILGIVFVRSIMCTGIVWTEELNEGVMDQIRSLFNEDDYGVKCMGEEYKEIKLGSGGTRRIGCVIRTDENIDYSLVVKDIEVLKGASEATVEKWIIDQNYEGDVTSGGKGDSAVVLVMDLPRDAPATKLKITIEEMKGGDPATKDTHISYIDIEPSGFFRTTMC